ncbi:MAG TPA: family 78 glycoside hydrolase catalytic domain [Mycobacteriales bacterium]|nr:family 78 glycoside hydrolase catalytic domain [Mycobacteriales bacterium]
MARARRLPRLLVVLLLAVGLGSPAAAGAKAAARPGAPTHLTVDDLTDPIGLGTDDVSFGWYVADPRSGAVQSAYRIRVVRPALTAGARTTAVWDSGRVRSPQQAFVAYAGPALAPDTTYRWTVQTWDGRGTPSAVSRPATFDTALRDGDWHADWIRRTTFEPEDTPTTQEIESGFGVWEPEDEYTYARKVATLSASPVVRARAYVSGDQQYELYVNGTLAGKGQAYSFPDEQYYETQDVTALLHAGAANAFGVIYSWQGPGKGRATGAPGVIVHISVLHADGTSETVVTDGTWHVMPGAWLPGTQRNEEGDPVDYTENIDGLLEPVGWSTPAFSAAAWLPATVIGAHPVMPWTHLVPVRTRIVYAPIHPVALTVLPSGAVVADFGAVYSAIPQVTFHGGAPGHLVRMHAGFLLDTDGSVSTTRGTQHTDMSYSYLQRGGDETFRPFDYLAFRYLQIDDPSTTLTADDVELLTRHAAVPDVSAGTFTSSDPTLDAVYRLAVHSALYTMQEQFVDTPTREKGSWLGDGRNESEAAMTAFGDVNMTRKSLLEFADSQPRFWPAGGVNKLYPTGIDPAQIPDYTELYGDWVWQYWLRTGDRTTVRTLLPVVQNLCDYIWRSIDPGTGLLTRFTGSTSATQLPVDTLLNALAVDVFGHTATMQAALGRPSATDRRRAAFVTHAINAHLVGPTGIYYAGLDAAGHPVTNPPVALNAQTRQADNAYALLFGVVPKARRARVERYVVAQQMATPPIFAGDLLQAIGLAGDDRAALHLLTDAQQPGWANILARGGTFGWEVWDPVDMDVPIGGTPVASFSGNGDSMSHGFSANVAVAIQQSLLGVRPTSPGFATFAVTPPRHVLTHASGTVPTPHGPITVSWQRGTRFTLTVTVPPNTTARVTLPTRDGRSVTRTVSAGRHVLHS